MKIVQRVEINTIYIAPKSSHKGMNGRLLIIGGSHLFHAASLWSLKIATRILDLVHYSSVEENNAIVTKLIEEFRDGIVIQRKHIDDYIEEDDCILIGPGMVRAEADEMAQYSNMKMIQTLDELESIPSEGIQTYMITKYLLQKYPHKKWVIDAGALQMMDPAWIPKGAILTPHHAEFKRLFGVEQSEESTEEMAKKYQCVILTKGEKDIVCSPEECRMVEGGNQGMTKGGTGDVLAGLVAALYCKNEAFLSALAASYINKKAGSDLAETMGYWFNASDLADQIPKTMKNLFL